MGYENFNSSLIRIGLLGSSPLLPKTAFSIKTLESYRLLRLHKPSLSIQSFAQSLCLTSSTKYTLGFRNRLSDAFDAYLAILRRVDQIVLHALGRDTPNWRIKNSCPCCNHRVPDEPRLEYDQIFAIDGGCSLKRLRDAGSTDSRAFESDYLVSEEKVNQFKYEAVKKSTRKTRKGRQGGRKENEEEDGEGGQHDNDQETDVALEVGEAEREIDQEGQEWITKNVQAEPGLEQDSQLTLCVERWKANADDDKKGMFSCFDEAGVFIAVCRHGFLLSFCDIIRSGEL